MAEVSEVSASPKGYPDPRYAWFVVVLLQIAFAVALVDRQILALLVEPIKADLQLSDTQFSLLAGLSFALFYGTLGLVLGKAADHRNRRNMIVIGMVLWSLATMACGLAESFHQLFLARMLVGVGEAALSPAAYSIIADYFPQEKRAKPIAFYTMGIFTGSGIALLFGAGAVSYANGADNLSLPVLGTLHPWQAVFLIVGVPGLVMAAAMYAVREPERRELSKHAAEPGELSRFISSHGGLLGLIIAAFALNGLIYYGIGTWVPATFIRKFGWTATEIGIVLGVCQLTAGTSGILLSSWWVERPRNRESLTIVLTLPRCAFLAMPPVALLFGFADVQAVVVVSLFVLVFLGALVSAQSAVALYRVTPNEFRGQVVAAYLLAGTLLGLGLGATLFAAVTDYGFGDDRAVGKSCGIVFTGAALLGAECLRRATRRMKQGGTSW